MQFEIEIATDGPGLYEFTDAAAHPLRDKGDGLLSLMVRHTSASLLMQENADTDVQRDLMAFFEKLVPHSNSPAMSYLTHTAEGPDDMPAHITASLLPVNLCIPVRNGRMRLGTWQGLYLFEHRDAPRTRQVAAHLRAD